MGLVLKHEVVSSAVSGGWGHLSLIENSTQVKSGFLLDCALQKDFRMSHCEAKLDLIKIF